MAAAGPTAGSGDTGLLSVLQRLQHLEDWAFEQITTVVGAEASGVLSSLQSGSAFEQRVAEVDSMLQQWFTGCDELVEARRLARRGWIDRMCHNVSVHRLKQSQLRHSRTMSMACSLVGS